MRVSITMTAVAMIAVPMALHAGEPNIQPGEWEYENVTTFQGDMEIPEQRETTRECITQEDIDDGLVTPDESAMGDCEITDQQIGRDSMSYSMSCVDPEGGSMTMNAQMDFMGDSASGTIDGEMESPMGQITVRTQMEGRRIGDC